MSPPDPLQGPFINLFSLYHKCCCSWSIIILPLLFQDGEGQTPLHYGMSLLSPTCGDEGMMMAMVIMALVMMMIVVVMMIMMMML